MSYSPFTCAPPIHLPTLFFHPKWGNSLHTNFITNRHYDFTSVQQTYATRSNIYARPHTHHAVLIPSKTAIRQQPCTFSFFVIAPEHTNCPYSLSFRPPLWLSTKKPAIAVDSLTASSEASKKQKILVLVSSNKTMESRPASPRSGHPESISSTSSALAPPAPIQRVCDSFSSSSSENEDESSRGHEDSGLAEALDREAARMAAANHLARARDELVKHMQATGMLKAVTPVQAEQAEAGEGQQQQQQQQGLGEVWPGGHGHGRGDEDFDELEAQEMERGSGNAGCQGAKHKVHGLGIAVDDRGQAAMVHEGEGKEDDEQHGKQGWEREGQWGHGQTSAGSLGSIGGVGLVVEGEMTGFVEGSEMTGLADRREARRTEKEAAEQKGSKMALEAEMEKHVGK